MNRAVTPARGPQEDGLTCAVSGFAGHEQQILRLRNTNRAGDETLAYLHWRYETGAGAPPPQVCWLLDRQAQPVGMVAIIFRPYWVAGVLEQVAVVGDISLDAQWRGRGLGQRLLRFMSAYLDEHFARHPGFVIPTESARRSLAQVGWGHAGELVPQVLLLQPARYLLPVLRSGPLARGLGRVLRAGTRAWAGRFARAGARLEIGDAPDPAVSELLAQAGGGGEVRRAASLELLNWRYVRHPHTRFRFATLRRAGGALGLAVFEDSSIDDTCTVYDLFAASEHDLRELLSRLAIHCLSQPRLIALRVLLDGRHPARAALRRVGFIARAPEAVYQVYAGAGTQASRHWCVSQGDKDT